VLGTPGTFSRRQGVLGIDLGLEPRHEGGRGSAGVSPAGGVKRVCRHARAQRPFGRSKQKSGSLSGSPAIDPKGPPENV